MTLVLAWVVTVGSLAGLLWVLTRIILRRWRSSATPDSDETAGFSLDRYQPMGRLMAEEDLVFLKSQPGYRAEMGERWKRERRRIFRLYLAELKADFRRLHAHARELAADSEAGSADLVEVLMKQQFTFLMATTALEFRLALQGIGVGRVDITPLIELVEAMRVDLAQRTAPHAA
ncbi:MAG TPA: hypothetical protein VL127_19955 [Bryobacteraceae bacterium]|jgi:hypothetical protein|nr:hypothetical protein [Bryobacteraceae bacterium]